MKSIKTIINDFDEDAFSLAMCEVQGVFISSQKPNKKSSIVEVTYTELTQLLKAYFLYGLYSKPGSHARN